MAREGGGDGQLAEQAEVGKVDILVEVNGQPYHSSFYIETVYKGLKAYPEGYAVHIKALRDGVPVCR
jgi:hypothetical protein